MYLSLAEAVHENEAIHESESVPEVEVRKTRQNFPRDVEKIILEKYKKEIEIDMKAPQKCQLIEFLNTLEGHDDSLDYKRLKNKIDGLIRKFKAKKFEKPSDFTKKGKKRKHSDDDDFCERKRKK